MIPMNSIVIAARPYLVLGAQSAAAGFAVFGVSRDSSDGR
jgi:hypothetical protein